MNWHTGNIAEAVAESKAKDAIFVVYIEGQDEMSAKLDRFLNDSRVNSKLTTADFVAVKIQGDSPTYAQFIALYKVVPVPSIFFIGNSGTPLDVTTGIIDSVEELVAKIDKVLLLAGKQTNEEAASTSNSQTDAPIAGLERSIAGEETKHKSKNDNKHKAQQEEEQQQAEQEMEIEATSEESISENNSSEAAAPEPIEAPELSSDVANEAPRPSIVAEPTAHSLTAAAAAETRAAAAATAATSSVLATAGASLIPSSVPLMPLQADSGSTRSSVREPAVDIQQLVDQKRAERQEEQRRRDKDNELRRRREGRDAQVAQAQAREQELKNMQERLRRERQEEQEMRDRIKAQIAADRAEQANRAEAQSVNTLSTTTNTVSSSSAESSGASNSVSAEETRLQIRLPGGITRTKTFAIEDPLATVRVYVTNELLAGSSNIRNFSLATSYPRREFQTEDEVKTLIELNLVPNAVLLVLQREQTNSVVRTGNNLFSMLASVLWAILTPATMAFDYLNKMGFQRVRQRFVQMVSNVGFKPSGRTLANDNSEASAQDVSTRRNLDLFMQQPQRPNAAEASTDDATSTHSSDPAFKPPTMFFSQGASSQRAGGGGASSSSNSGGGSFKRYGAANIRRLADTKDDEDDKATYNGNSTQQQ
ncbi:hypothetical protein KR044_006229 [Drosophila immigrans]|nr:hypothetical protein KR044_006229 [Drosophila immigrans]